SLATLPNVENLYGFGSGDLSLVGNNAANYLRGSTGNDTLDGGGGLDTAVYTGARSLFVLSNTGSNWTVSAPGYGNDTFKDIEFIQYSDVTLALDSSAPTVSSFNPSDETAGVAIGANIVLSFSESIQRGSGSIVLKTAGGVVVATYDAATSGNLAISGST